MSALATLVGRCRRLGINLFMESNGWYWQKGSGEKYGPYLNKVQAALNALQAQEYDK